MPIDLRSDSLARPTTAMLEVMKIAAQSPPGLHFDENREIVALENEIANKLGKESALFCPTCTMCNQIAIKLNCGPGDTFVTEQSAHVATTERGSASLVSGATPVFVKAERGTPDLAELETLLASGAAKSARPRLVVLENTHVHSGGAVIPASTFAEVRALADGAGAAVHLDGSRLFNAAVHDGVSIDVLAGCADTVAISLNKALGAPMGAALAGSAEMIREAARTRRLLGGDWRSAGMIAAAARVALSLDLDRLRMDHLRARRLANAFARCAGVTVDVDRTETNIVFVYRRDDAPEHLRKLQKYLFERSIYVLGYEKLFRAVTYSEIGDEEIETVEQFLIDYSDYEERI